MGASEYIDNQQGQLEINRYYWFLLKKKTTMPDGIEYFVMEDPFGNKHMMETEPYKHYKFELGQKVEIRIDKINCTGKVFFEPKHPKYSLGASLKVPFMGHGTELDKFKEEVHVLLVKDPYGNITSVRPLNNEQRKPAFNPEFLQCEVHRISKGRLILRQIG